VLICVSHIWGKRISLFCSESVFGINLKVKHSLKTRGSPMLMKEVVEMKRVLAVITVELVDESVGEKADVIKEELLRWFEEDCFFIPWVKKVKDIVVRKEGTS
jgi:aminoglycoside phosphotransferase